MTDEQRLQTTAKLCHEVLGAVPDGQLSLEGSHWVIADSLLLLACKEIKLRCGYWLAFSHVLDRVLLTAPLILLKCVFP